ncbi:ABC transporter ATP-binding protein [Limnochorda pilosa]|uniref:ABC transporter n=1 Tax=Limnochorda pilosa TaxID=1555112 RepID=A0A0K2SG32_LIMPI|nr:ABC transporter ATP-binding protein [Limnochorda pilosa]BAS26063.1 ABC transporter [Limnochorda pilosa]
MGRPAILDVQGLEKSFGGIKAVDGLTFSVPQGSITGLVGPNGAGKTTAFNLIAGVLKPDGGQIRFLGRRIDGLAAHQVAAQGILRTFQIPRGLGQMTVLENLMVVPLAQPGESLWNVWTRPGRVVDAERSIRRRAMEVLEFVHLTELKDELAAHLSGGQKKLLELARTLMGDPVMILLDEPGAGVNPSLMRDLVRLIGELRDQGKTFLLIEHDMDLVAELCDPVLVMHQGRLLAQGTLETIRTNPIVVEAYLGGVPTA